MTSDASNRTTNAPHHDNSATELAGFFKFSKLPAEIQVKIWRLALPVFKNEKRQLRDNICLSYPDLANSKDSENKVIFDMNLDIDHYKAYVGVSGACFKSRKIFLKAFPDSLPCFRSGPHPGIFLRKSVIQVKEPNTPEGKIYFAKEDTLISLMDAEPLRQIYSRGLVGNGAQSGDWSKSIQHLVISENVFWRDALTKHIKLALLRFPELKSFTYESPWLIFNGGSESRKDKAITLNTFIDSVKYRKPMKKLWPGGYLIPKVYCSVAYFSTHEECYIDHEGTRFRYPGVKRDEVAGIER